MIVWFDVRSEKFGFINKDEYMLPKPNEYDTSPSTLFNYKDKLGLHRRVEQNLVSFGIPHSHYKKTSGY